MSATPILLVHYGENWIRGSERCLLDLLAHLDRSRFAPLLWCNNQQLAEEAALLGVKALVEPFALLLGWQAPRFDLAAHRALCQRAQALISEHGITLVHANSAAPCQWLAGVCRKMKVPLVCHLHARYQPRDRFTLRVHQANVLIGVSQPVLASWLEDGFEQNRLVHISNGVDDIRLNRGEPWSAIEELGLAPDNLIVATIGSLIKRKGIDLLIRSLAELVSTGEEAQLLVIGSGPELKALTLLAADLGVSKRVHFLGERHDSAAILRGGVDLLASGAREEVFGLTLAEAGMLGLPVCAYRVGGIPEVVEHGVTGLLSEPGDWIQMASYWRRLRDHQLRYAMGEAGKCRAEKFFTIDGYVTNVMEVWSDALVNRWEAVDKIYWFFYFVWLKNKLISTGRNWSLNSCF
ncbi:glycosyl transferase [Aeromonas hydrophila]|nr:glycosyltransferase family 4 protein [Aeromonas hydrophila]BCO14101.1 glycosyl transferase [Aeromonas hydrophila]